MNASKENAAKALDYSRKGIKPEFVRDFLAVAIKKLPSEAAYEAAKRRPAIAK